jgi:hypothetical protein
LRESAHRPLTASPARAADPASGELGFRPPGPRGLEEFGQRPKLDDYDHDAFLVAYGHGSHEDSLVEVHCYYSEVAFFRRRGWF